MTSNLNALDPLNATVRARLDQALRDHLPDPAASDAPRLGKTAVTSARMASQSSDPKKYFWSMSIVHIGEVSFPWLHNARTDLRK